VGHLAAEPVQSLSTRLSSSTQLSHKTCRPPAARPPEAQSNHGHFNHLCCATASPNLPARSLALLQTAGLRLCDSDIFVYRDRGETSFCSQDQEGHYEQMQAAQRHSLRCSFGSTVIGVP
jgi:hypothetical protein